MANEPRVANRTIQPQKRSLNLPFTSECSEWYLSISGCEKRNKQSKYTCFKWRKSPPSTTQTLPSAEPCGRINDDSTGIWELLTRLAAQHAGCFEAVTETREDWERVEELRYSNERSTIFQSLSHKQKHLEEVNGKMVALQISPKIESLYGLGQSSS